jgi:hypothetical protein
MPRGRKKAVVETPQVEKPVIVKSLNFGGVAISDPYGKLVRTYTAKDHGPRFAELADCFLRDRPHYKKDVILD